MNPPAISPKRKPDEPADKASSRTSRIDSADHDPTNQEALGRFDYDLTNPEDVKAYLEQHQGLKKFRLQQLSGGTANHVYRMVCEDGDSEEKWILKHAAAQLASNPAFNLDQSRVLFEAKILSNPPEDECCYTINKTAEVTESGAQRMHVHTLPLIFFDEDRKLLCMQDAGDQNLKAAYATLDHAQVQEIGTALGRWLANLHGETPLSSVLGESNQNNYVGTTIARYTYSNLAESLRQATQDEDLADMGSRVDAWFGNLMNLDTECVCHGDFWPGNIMLQGESPTGGPSRLTVIDWEMVRVGNSATDVGQFAAEAFLLDRFHGGKGLHTSFIRSYFRSSAVKFGVKDWLYPWMTRVAIHFATHLAFWPSRRVHWANKEDTKALVDLAIVVLEDALSEVPNAAVWRVFEGVPGLDEIAREMMVKRGSAIPGHVKPN